MNKILAILFLFLIIPNFVLAEDRIEINTASLEQLDEITGIGPVLAQRIIDARPFSSVDDLLGVKGIGEKTLQKIKDQGLAYVERQTPQLIVEMPIVEEKPAEDRPPRTYLAGVIINETLPNPEGADEENEWIELYNTNNFEVDLSGWKIEDAEGAKTTYIFDKNTKIAPNGFLILKRPETKITLNNEGDGLKILWPTGEIVDSMSFIKAPLGQSYNKTASGWDWSKTLTPGKKNTLTTTENKSDKNLLNMTKSDNSNGIEAGTAAINELTNQEDIKNSSPWFLFLTAVAITIISSAAVLFIKFKLNKKHVRT